MIEQRNEYIYYDNAFRKLANANARVLKLFEGSLWAEGPVYFRDGNYLLWSDIPNNRILRWTPDATGAQGHTSVFRQPSNNSNGQTRDREGRLISCEHGARRVTRTELDGSITVIADQFEGKQLNSPNDVVVKSDGTIWFTDPPYGIHSDYEGHKSEQEYGACYVFRADPKDGSLTVASDAFPYPNGIAFSQDEKRLYVANTGKSFDPSGQAYINMFDVADDNSVSNNRFFAAPDVGSSDGFRVDTDGRVWTSAGDGIHCFDSGGTLLGKILVPEAVANITFGGLKNNRIFITATTSLYAVYTHVNGAQTP